MPLRAISAAAMMTAVLFALINPNQPAGLGREVTMLVWAAALFYCEKQSVIS